MAHPDCTETLIQKKACTINGRESAGGGRVPIGPIRPIGPIGTPASTLNNGYFRSSG